MLSNPPAGGVAALKLPGDQSGTPVRPQPYTANAPRSPARHADLSAYEVCAYEVCANEVRANEVCANEVCEVCANEVCTCTESTALTCCGSPPFFGYATKWSTS